jgi:hypothetical protein
VQILNADKIKALKINKVYPLQECVNYGYVIASTITDWFLPRLIYEHNSFYNLIPIFEE